MKLRTKMQDGCVHANGYCVDEDAVELRQAEMLVHDAAAAHAYKQAVAEHHSSVWLEERASEIMRELGFDSGEDSK